MPPVRSAMTLAQSRYSSAFRLVPWKTSTSGPLHFSGLYVKTVSSRPPAWTTTLSDPSGKPAVGRKSNQHARSAQVIEGSGLRWSSAFRRFRPSPPKGGTPTLTSIHRLVVVQDRQGQGGRGRQLDAVQLRVIRSVADSEGLLRPLRVLGELGLLFVQDAQEQAQL